MESFPGIGGEVVVILAVCSSLINFAIAYSAQYFVEAAGYGYMMLCYGLCVVASLAAGIACYLWGKEWRRRCAPRYYRFLAEKEGQY